MANNTDRIAYSIAIRSVLFAKAYILCDCVNILTLAKIKLITGVKYVAPAPTAGGVVGGAKRLPCPGLVGGVVAASRPPTPCPAGVVGGVVGRGV